MNEIALKRPEDMSAEELGGEIRLLTQQARGMLLSYGIQIGYRLKLVQEKVEHFPEWVERETEFSKSGAYRYIKLFEEYGGQTGVFGVENAFPTLGKLSISNALRLLAVPEEEREEFALEVDAEHLSARELEKAIKERDDAKFAQKIAETERDNAEKERAKIEENLREACDTIKELENRPIEVAVQRDEEAIREAAENARKEAEKAAKEKLDAEKAKLKEAEAKLKSAEDKAKAADKKSRETAEALEKAKAQLAGGEDVEALKKRLEAAESGTGEAAIYCRAAQQNMAQAIEKVKAMHEGHPETAEKLAGGLRQIIEAMRQGVAAMEEKWHV